jgi:hypothetical protein
MQPPKQKNIEKIAESTNYIYGDGLTAEELNSLKRSLKEVAMIKKGELKPLSMNDLWSE